MTGSANDPGGAYETLIYTWSVLKDGAAFASGGGVDMTTFTFTPDDNGSYYVTLSVDDGNGGNGNRNQTITVENVGPTPDAGGPYTVDRGGNVALSGSATDPGINDTLTYAWDLDLDGVFGETGAAATCGDENVQNPTFYAADAADANGKTIVWLRVTDNAGDSGYATAEVTVTTSGDSPVVDAGGPYAGQEGNLDVSLTATPGGNWSPTSYAWDLNDDGIYGNDAGENEQNATIWAGDGPGTRLISVLASDAAGHRARGFSMVDLLNVPPTVSEPAEAGSTTVPDNYTTLTVLGADANGESNLTYTWSITEKPEGVTAPFVSNNGTNYAKDTIISFYAAGTYTMHATITDPYNSSTNTADLTIDVQQTLTNVTVTPDYAAVNPLEGAQFSAVAEDQFGYPMASEPEITWALDSGPGSIDPSDGLCDYTASESDGVPHVAVVTASVLGIVAKANVDIIGGWAYYRAQTGDSESLYPEYAHLVSADLSPNSDWSTWVLADSYEDALKQTISGSVAFYYDGPGDDPNEIYQLDFPEALDGDAFFSSLPGWVGEHSRYEMTIGFGRNGFEDFSTEVYFQTADNWYVGAEAYYDAAIYAAAAGTEGQAGMFRIYGYNGSTATTPPPAQPLTVNLEITGSAVSGQHYQLFLDGSSEPFSGSSVTLPSGAGYVSLVVKPLWNASWPTDGYPSPKEVSLQILSSQGGGDNKEQSYTAGPQSQAKVSVQTDNNWEVNDWSGPNPTAKPKTDHDSLAKLAWDITGCAGPWNEFPANEPLKAGTKVPIKPLLDILEGILRANVVAAANAPKPGAGFPERAASSASADSLTEAGVNAVFTEPTPVPPSPPNYDCKAMVRIIFAKGLINALEPGEFDRMGFTVSSVCSPEYRPSRPVAFADLKPGDGVYFRNNEMYPDTHDMATACWKGENLIVTGGDSFWGWAGAYTGGNTAQGWITRLFDGYNEDLLPGCPELNCVEQVPGYDGNARFFTVPKVAEKIFNERTKTAG